MVGNDEVLLDAFVRIRPDTDFLAAIDNVTDAAIARMQQKFGAANLRIPAPTVPAPPSPPQNPSNPAGGGRPPGGGGRPPGAGGGANPPGGQPPGNPGLAGQFRDARREVEDLEEALRQLNLVKTEIKTDATKKDLQLIDTQIREINVLLTRGQQDQDPLGLQEALNRLPSLEQRLQRLSVNVSQTRILRDEFDALKAGGTDQIAQGRLRANVAQSQIRGLPSGDLRQAILLQTAAVREQELQVNRVSKAFDGTNESVERLRASIVSLRDAQDALDETQTSASQAGRSFNTLSNNAYQAGQAIEDFAVGFSLNGFAGGVRGAANNVAFLLNDVSRLASVQKALPAGWAQQLPLIAGIGSALAIVVLPKLVEWLESLNDIETKTKDISEELKRGFEEVDFEIDLRGTEASLRRTISEASNVREILNQIRDLSFDSEQKKIQIGSIFTGFEDSGGLQKVRESIREVSGLVTDQIDLLLRRRNAGGAEALLTDPLNELLGPFGADTSLKALDSLKSVQAEVGKVAQGIEVARLNTKNGIIDSEQLSETEKGLLALKKTVAEFAASGDLANEKFGEEFAANMTVLQDRFAQVRDIAKEIESIRGEQLAIAFGAAARKVTELQDQLDLSRAVAIDVNVDFDLDLLALDAQINEGRRILTDSIKSIRESVPNTPDREAGIKSLEEEFRVRSLLSVEQLQSTNLKEREKLEERILDIKERQRQSAKFTNLEEFARTLQINALSSNDEESRRRKRLADLEQEKSENIENFKRIKEARDAIEGGREFGQAATRPRVLEGTGGTGFQPFFLDMMVKAAESAMEIKNPDVQQLKPEDVKNAIAEGVREGMKAVSEGFGGKAVDAIGKLKGVAVAQ